MTRKGLMLIAGGAFIFSFLVSLAGRFLLEWLHG
jgi:hypothetical protein